MQHRTLGKLREMIWDDIDALRAKKTTAANLNALTNAAGKILTTVKMEMEYAKLMGRQPKMGFIELEDIKIEPKIERNIKSNAAPVGRGKGDKLRVE